MTTRYRAAVLLVLSWLSTDVRAEGFPTKKGRYSGGPVVLIQLTDVQRAAVGSRSKPCIEVQLTSEQTEKLRVEGKLAEGPTKLAVCDVKDLEGDCTCSAANLSFDFQPGWTEVPIEFLCSDAAAKARRERD